jgi:hypothetical protein
MGPETFLPMLALGIFAIFRLGSMLHAKRLLDSTLMPSTMRLTRL